MNLTNIPSAKEVLAWMDRVDGDLKDLEHYEKNRELSGCCSQFIDCVHGIVQSLDNEELKEKFVSILVALKKEQRDDLDRWWEAL